MSTPSPSSSSSVRDSIDGKIKFRMLMLLGLLIFKLVAVVRLINTHEANPAWLLLGVGGGIVVGIIASRMHLISWDHSKKAVVSQMDVVGIIVLVGYILYAIFSDDLVEMGIDHAATAGLVATSMAAATTLVRLGFTYRNVADVLREAGLISKTS